MKPRQFLSFNLTLLKESILYGILILDCIGILLFYFTNFDIPKWILWLLPIIALYLASFKIYSRYFGKVEIRAMQSGNYRVSAVYENTVQGVERVVDAYFINTSSSDVSIDDVKIKYGLNSIFDKYLLRKAGVYLEMSKIWDPRKSQIYRPRNFENEFDFPITVKRDSILPFKILIRVYFESHNEETLMESIAWLKSINLIFKCTLTSLIETKSQNFKIDFGTSDIKETVKNYKAK